MRQRRSPGPIDRLNQLVFVGLLCLLAWYLWGRLARYQGEAVQQVAAKTYCLLFLLAAFFAFAMVALMLFPQRVEEEEKSRLSLTPEEARLLAAGRDVRGLLQMSMPRELEPCAPGCASIVAAYLAALAWLVFGRFRFPGFALVLLALPGLLGIVVALALMRGYLASRRLAGSFDVAARVSPGDSIQVGLELVSRMTGRLDGVRIALFCLRRTAVLNENRDAHFQHELLHDSEQRLPGAMLFHGERRSYEATFALPEDAPATADGNPIVCWLVSARAELPGWPDLRLLREVEVS